MTHFNDDQSFENELDRAVRDMHKQTPRGNQPPTRVWESIALQASISEVNSSQPRDKVHDTAWKPHSRFKTGNTETLNPGSSYLSPISWIATVLVVVLIAVGANFWLPKSNNGGDGTEHSIALAPTTFSTELGSSSDFQVATPFAGQNDFSQTFGPEYACKAEPLTEDQVFDIVMNPYRERVRRGSTNAPPLSKPFQDILWVWLTTPDYSGYAPINDHQLSKSLLDASNQFWNCLMTGSAFQVWGMMDPALVQAEILDIYPVVRDEAVLKQHIKEWGPRSYSSSLRKFFPVNSSSSDPVEVSMTADETFGATLVQYSAPEFDGTEGTRAQVTMLPHPDSTGRGMFLIRLDFVRAADGTWWATRISYDSP